MPGKNSRLYAIEGENLSGRLSKNGVKNGVKMESKMESKNGIKKWKILREKKLNGEPE